MKTTTSAKNILTVYKDSRNLLWIGHSHGISVWDQKNDSINFSWPEEWACHQLRQSYYRRQQQTNVDRYGKRYFTSPNSKWKILHCELYHKRRINMQWHQYTCYTQVGQWQYLNRYPQRISDNHSPRILATDYHANIYVTGIELKSGIYHPNLSNESSLECTQTLSFTEKENSFIYLSLHLTLQKQTK